MTDAAPHVLQLLLSRGVPRPLSGLSTGSCAVLSQENTISVFDSEAADWTLTAQARWPEDIALDSHPWAALAPHESGVVLLNMTACDISALPVEVRMSLEMQHQRYSPASTPASTLAPRFRVVTDSGQVRITAPTGTTRVLPIGAAYTVTEDAYRRHEELTFSYLSPSLRVVARAISLFGPLSTNDLLHRVYPAPTDKNKSALNMTLSRLRHHPRVNLDRLDDGRLTITHGASVELPSGQAS
ncbi:hypothetical protein [Mycolicibacterium sp. 120270]|uniref:hypothetical protein n=1 Tax=Mycolicibacterium sp. 120270 TaxID=3090600 RepID=UPI00299DE52B|nr:hypothetical protein [Mycolicibacterium sp. 120270]MDX1886905.1 hypothetical protein [Mycolicibacterium sp. 120270]